MKKVPSVRMPDPALGVIRSEHPRNVGVQGLVEAYNWVSRNGIIRQRDGITPIETVQKVVIEADAWTDEGGNVWSYTLASLPSRVWIDYDIGTYTGPVTPDTLGEWTYLSGDLLIYSTSDPYTGRNVYYEPSATGTSVVGLVSYDYQGQDSSDVQQSVRDQLIAVTDSDIWCYNNDLTTVAKAQETNVDWAWEGAVGPGTTPDQKYIVSPKISIDWSNISWTVLEAMHGSAVYGVGFTLDIEYYNPAGITLHMWTFDANTTKSVGLADGGAGTAVWSNNKQTISSTEYESGYPWQVLRQASGTGTGIYFIFSDTWSSWYDELIGQGQNPASSDITYSWAVYQAEDNGLPGGDAIVSLDSSLRPVFRTWDYEQSTHVLMAAKDKYILDIDSKTFIDSDVRIPEVSVSGDAGVAPRARCIGIASQRVIAGNVSLYSSTLTCEVADTAGKLSAAGASGVNGWCSIVDQFAYFPDAVVYSGTVLTGGHKYWYPADILRLADTAGDIVALQEMGTQQIAVYKTDSIYTLTAQSGVSPFAPSLRASGISGPVGPRAVVAISDQTHVYLARDGGLYMFSGGTPQSLGDQFRDWISREIDAESYADDSFLHYDPENNEIHVYYPVKGSGGVVRKGVIVDVSKQPFVAWPVMYPFEIYNEDEDDTVEFGLLCATNHWIGGQDVLASDITIPASEAQTSPTTRYSELLFGTVIDQLEGTRSGVEDGRIFKTINNGNDNGIAIECMMESGISDLGDPDNQKVLLEMELLFDNVADSFLEAGGTDLNVQLTIYGGDSNTSLSQLWQDTSISISSGQVTVHPRVRARYFSYKLVVTMPVEDYDEPGKDWTQSYGDAKYWGAIARFKVSGVRQN